MPSCSNFTHYVVNLVYRCPDDLAKTLVNMTYADLLTTNTGRDIARNLVSAIINIQIGQNLSIDAISDVLQQRCGSFCSADDVLLYKVYFFRSSERKSINLIRFSGHRKYPQSQIRLAKRTKRQSSRIPSTFHKSLVTPLLFQAFGSHHGIQFSRFPHRLYRLGPCMCQRLGSR